MDREIKKAEGWELIDDGAAIHWVAWIVVALAIVAVGAFCAWALLG